MNVGVIGLGHVFEKQYEAIKDIKNFEKISICDINFKKILNVNANFKTTNYKDLLNICDVFIIETNPESHLEIATYFLENKKKILLEKPIITNQKELNELNQLINKENFYSMLHFSNGLEIDYFIKNINKRPKKIRAYISDKYILNNNIINESFSLCGAYLDETINPLSAICKMFGYNVTFVDVVKKYYNKDKYDYYSLSKYKLDEIFIEIEVLWNTSHNSKYIDLFYDDFVLRLDSMNQSIINLNNNKELFKGYGIRMKTHYLGVFNDFILNGSNINKSIKLHSELLKGV